MLIDLIAAARPNFMKVAPLYHALTAAPDFTPRLIHTGQHYDANMSDSFFADLGLPTPDKHLGVGGGSHADQTAGVVLAYEKIIEAERPTAVVVVGDVNATASCSLVAAKAWVPVVHLEAGLRSGDRRMPEEINRLVTDAIADVFWTPSPDADDNLRREGVPEQAISRVGNIMIDSFELQRAAIAQESTATTLGLAPGGYGVITLHRPSNVDDAATLTLLVDQLVALSARLPLVFPIHPRTRERLRGFGLLDRLTASAVHCLEPQSYRQFMSLVLGARLVATDSGGVQEETTYLDIPCLTLRENTERPITVTQGTNRLTAPADLLAQAERALAGDWPHGVRPDRWDGQTAQRCVADLRQRVANNTLWRGAMS